MRVAASQETLASALWPTGERASVLRAITLAAAGSILLTISAKLQVPFWPVPMTMQTMVVLVLGFTLGPVLGGASVLLYLAEGMLGLPVFAGTPEKGIGLAYMAGPTGGYLAGFLVATLVLGALAERGWGRRPITALAGLLVGDVLIYGCGVTWLSVLLGWEEAVAFGIVPFLAGEGLKVALAAALLPLSWRVAQRRSA
jgi:biotin transport system substrate-specific component